MKLTMVDVVEVVTAVIEVEPLSKIEIGKLFAIAKKRILAEPHTLNLETNYGIPCGVAGHLHIAGVGEEHHKLCTFENGGVWRWLNIALAIDVDDEWLLRCPEDWPKDLRKMLAKTRYRSIERAQVVVVAIDRYMKQKKLK